MLPGLMSGEGTRKLNQLHCRHCGQPIGVYEPLVALVEGSAHETSRAAEPAACDSSAPCYHAGCYEQAQAGGALGD